MDNTTRTQKFWCACKDLLLKKNCGWSQGGDAILYQLIHIQVFSIRPLYLNILLYDPDTVPNVEQSNLLKGQTTAAASAFFSKFVQNHVLDINVNLPLLEFQLSYAYKTNYNKYNE